MSCSTNLFDFRDHLDGNESDEPPSDTENEETEAEDAGTEIEASGENLEFDENELDSESANPDEGDDDPMREEVEKVLNYMDNVGIKLVDFLDGLSWGTPATT